MCERVSLRKIMVLLRGKAVDEDAMALACRQAREVGARLYPVVAVEMRRSVPLDAADLPEMEAPRQWLEAAEARAAALGCGAKGAMLTARAAGPAIVDEIVERCVDLLVMGIAYDRRQEQFDLDDAARHILKHAPCQVWVVRDALLSPPSQSSR